MQASPSQASPQPPAANTSVTPGAPPAAGITSVKAGTPPVAESAFQPTPGEVTILLLVAFSSFFFVFVFVLLLLRPVETSSLHKGCHALQVVQAAEKLPWIFSGEFLIHCMTCVRLSGVLLLHSSC